MEHEAPPTGALPYNTVPTVVTVALELGLATSTTLKRVGYCHTWCMSQTSSNTLKAPYSLCTRLSELQSTRCFQVARPFSQDKCQAWYYAEASIRHFWGIVPMYQCTMHMITYSRGVPWNLRSDTDTDTVKQQITNCPSYCHNFLQNASMCEPLPEVQKMNLVKYKQKSKIQCCERFLNLNINSAHGTSNY